MKKINWWQAWILIVVAVVIYLNAGWAIGTYYHNYIFGHQSQTFWQTVWHGGFDFFYRELGSLSEDQMGLMFFWPLFVCMSLSSWIVYGIYYLLWLIFAGGIAKLLGVG